MSITLFITIILTIMYITFLLDEGVHNKILSYTKIDIFLILMSTAWVYLIIDTYIGTPMAICIGAITIIVVLFQQIMHYEIEAEDRENENSAPNNEQSENDVQSSHDDTIISIDPILNNTGIVTRLINQKNFIGQFDSGEKKGSDVLIYSEEALSVGDRFKTVAIDDGHIVAEKL